MATDNLHIVFLPWLAFGHLLPFYHLASRIANLGHRISFLSSPRNLSRLPPIPPHLSGLFNFVKLPMPSLEQLPSGVEATVDLHSEENRPYLRIAFDSFQHHLRTFLNQQSPDWIIFDYAAFWLPAIANELDIPCAFLSIFNAALLGFLRPTSVMVGSEEGHRAPEDLMLKPKWVDFDTKIALKGYEARTFFEHVILPDNSGVSEIYRAGRAMEGCKLIAVRTSNEFEHNWLRLLERIYQKPVIPTGFSSPRPQLSEHRNDSTIQWLDKQKQRSVLFAAFGSDAPLSGLQVLEIARGLELSLVPFVWVLRASAEVIASLPNGFVEGVQERGVVCMGWAPQAELLAHQSVGGFLTHAGWGSTVEGLSRGLAMVMLPFMSDQGLNSRNLVERGLGVEVARNEEDGSFVGEAIADAVRFAMVDEKGETIRNNAMKAKDIFGDEELNERYVEQFVDYLAGNRNKKDL